MHPIRILAELRIRGYTCKLICEETGKHPSSFYNTIHNRPFPSPEIRQKIAEILEKPIEELWPECDLVAA